MDAATFRAFVKEALSHQTSDEDTPPGYLETRAAVIVKLGMDKTAGSAAAELAGLGMLAIPSVQEMRGKPQKEKTKAKWELAGLGTLAAPYVHDAAKKNKTYAGLANRVGKALGR